MSQLSEEDKEVEILKDLAPIISNLCYAWRFTISDTEDMAAQLNLMCLLRYRNHYNPKHGTTPQQYLGNVLSKMAIDYVRTHGGRMRNSKKNTYKERGETVSFFVDEFGKIQSIYNLAALARTPSLEIKNRLQRAIRLLGKQEQACINRYFFDNLRQEQVGQDSNISDSRVSQVITKAINKLKTIYVEQDSEWQQLMHA